MKRRLWLYTKRALVIVAIWVVEYAILRIGFPNG